MIELSKENFKTEISGSEPVIVDFWAEWCAPCRTLEPILEELSKEFDGKLKFCKANVDDNPDISAQNHITSVPTVLIFKNGSVVDQFTGAYSKKQIQKRLESVLE